VAEKKTGNPFAALEALRESLPPGVARKPVEKTPRGPARAVLRLERKGRGGKEVTVLEKLELPAKQLETWARELKSALGVGGTVEGETIVLAGDCRDRLAKLLVDRGVGKVTRG
jgi:translation initiation factor 1